LGDFWQSKGTTVTTKHAWVVIADSPFLPARGGGEREHLGFVRAAVATDHLALLVIPSSEALAMPAYDELLGDVPVLVTRRRENKLLLARPLKPYVVSSRPVRKDLLRKVRQLAPQATGVVVFSYKSWRIGEAVARELGVPAVLRQHNLEGAYHRSLAEGTTGPRGLALTLEARRIERDERRLEHASWLSAMADISATDAEVRRQRGGRAVHVPPFAQDASLLALPRTPEAGPRVLFIGALDVATNATALDWLLRDVWPSVGAQVPGAVLDIVGRGPTEALRRRLLAEPGVVLHADVPDIHPFLARASVAVNPAVSGSGVNIKLVDYLQAGVPVVTTTLGSQGLGLLDGAAYMVRDDPESFAEALGGLLRDPERAEALGSSGRHRIAELLDPETNIRRLEAELTPAPDPAAPSPAPPRSKNALSVEVEDLEHLAGSCRAEWDHLFTAQTGVANPFCAPEWVEAWYRSFTRPADRHLLAVRRGAELVGVAPFYIEPFGRAGALKGSRLRLVGAGQGGSLLELPQVLAAPGHARDVLRAVVAETIKRSPGGRAVDWAEITVPTAHGWFEPEWAYSTGEPVAFHRAQLARACVVLPLDGSWEATRGSLKRNLKESLRRSRNRLAKDGRSYEIVAHTEDLDESTVERFLALHRQRSQHEASVVHSDAYADDAHQAFLRSVLPSLGRRGRATLLELHLDGEVVAVQLALFAPGVTYLHSSGVLPEVWAMGPVTHLQEQLAKQAADRGDRWVNFSPGPNVAKVRWSEQIDVHQDFAYGSGENALRWKYGAFAMGQALGQVRHQVATAGAHQAPARADQQPERDGAPS
jgi:glycosyltransferase involved in cell wall biosynthesis/CelD/BcsL family acetyltransferase involved in cellulose biosynthesis